MKNQEFIKRLSQLSKDIILYNSDRKDLTDSQKREEFYKIMKKYGIKQGTWSKNGNSRICDNFEWSLCKIAFNSTSNSNFEINSLFTDDIPKELLAYGKQPKPKKPWNTY